MSFSEEMEFGVPARRDDFYNETQNIMVDIAFWKYVHNEWKSLGEYVCRLSIAFTGNFANIRLLKWKWRYRRFHI